MKDYLLLTIRKYHPLTTADLRREVRLIAKHAPWGPGETVDGTLAELVREGLITRDGKAWAPVFVEPAQEVPQLVQGGLFSGV